MPFVGRTGLAEDDGEVLQQEVQAHGHDGPRGARRGHHGAPGGNTGRGRIAAQLPGVGPEPNPNREGRKGQDDQDDPHREDTDGRQAPVIRGQRLAVRGLRYNNRTDRQAHAHAQPACPSLHRAALRLPQLPTPHGDRQRGSREGGKDNRWDKPMNADGGAQQGDGLMGGGRAQRRDQPYPQPVPEPEPEQRRGNSQRGHAIPAGRMLPAQRPGRAPDARRLVRQQHIQRDSVINLPRASIRVEFARPQDRIAQRVHDQGQHGHPPDQQLRFAQHPADDQHNGQRQQRRDHECPPDRQGHVGLVDIMVLDVGQFVQDYGLKGGGRPDRRDRRSAADGDETASRAPERERRQPRVERLQ